MSWNDFLGGDVSASADPLEVLQQISGSAPPQNMIGGPVAKLPALPASTIPTKPLPPGPFSNAVQPGGSADWKALLAQIGPLIAGAALHEPGQRSGFYNGYMQGQQLGNAERQKKDAAAQARNQAAANFRLEVGQHALAIDDPVQRAQFIDLAESSGETAGLIKKGDLADLRTVPASQAARARLKLISDEVDKAEKQGYSLDDLVTGGAVFHLSDGTLVNASTARDLLRPQTAGGAAIPKPPKDKRGFSKVDVVMNDDTTKTKREINYDPDTGKYSDPDTGKTIPSTSFTKYSAPPSMSETERGAALLGQIRDAKAKGDKATADRLQAQYNDLQQVHRDTSAAGRDPLLEAIRALQANPGGGLTEDAIDYAATQYRITGVMPSMGRSQGGRTAIVNRAAQQAKDLGQSPAQAIQKQYALKSDAAALTQMRKMSSAAESYETKALAQADIVESLSNKVSRTQYPIINDALLAGKARIAGDADTQLLFNALATFTTEYAKIMEGSTGSAAASSDSARASAAKLISAGLSKGTLAQTLNLMRKEMALTIQGYDATIEHITGRMGGAPSSTSTPPPSPPAAGGVPTYQDYLRSRGGHAARP